MVTTTILSSPIMHQKRLRCRSGSMPPSRKSLPQRQQRAPLLLLLLLQLVLLSGRQGCICNAEGWKVWKNFGGKDANGGAAGGDKQNCVDQAAYAETVQKLKRAEAEKDRVTEELQEIKKGGDVSKTLENQFDKATKRAQKLEEEKNALAEELNAMRSQISELNRKHQVLLSKTDEAAIDAAIEEGVFKRIASQVKDIKAEIEKDWKSKVDALKTDLANANDQCESKIETVKVEVRQREKNKHDLDLQGFVKTQMQEKAKLKEKLEDATKKAKGLEIEKTVSCR